MRAGRHEGNAMGIDFTAAGHESVQGRCQSCTLLSEDVRLWKPTLSFFGVMPSTVKVKML